MSQRLRDVHSVHGQSPWIDNLQRSYLTSGRLHELIRRGIRGLTSNPTIFQKAIENSSDYDEQFADALRNGRSVADAYWDLVLADIEAAAQVFAPVHEESDGIDGYVSVEVDPSLSHHAADTLTQARLLHDRLGRANVMIKIPATTECLGTIADMIAEGRSVNVTLIFGLDRYQQVMNAYLDGLERAHRDGRNLANVASVASFFISRVDSEVDRRLRERGRPDLAGTTAVNQARLAYELFEETFSGSRWDALAAAGARVQRPLWASTSTKDPSYPDTKYVDALIGPRTVNTLPESTMEAFDDHGTLETTIDKHRDLAHEQWDELASIGVDMNDVADQLEREGVAAFQESFTSLLASLHNKAESLH